VIIRRLAVNLSLNDLMEAIKLDRYSDDCGSLSPSRAEAEMILRRRWKAADAVIAALGKLDIGDSCIGVDNCRFSEPGKCLGDRCPWYLLRLTLAALERANMG